MRVQGTCSEHEIASSVDLANHIAWIQISSCLNGKAYRCSSLGGRCPFLTAINSEHQSLVPSSDSLEETASLTGRFLICLRNVQLIPDFNPTGLSRYLCTQA